MRLADHITALRAWWLIASLVRRKPGVLRPGFVGMRSQWSYMTMACKIIEYIPPPQLIPRSPDQQPSLTPLLAYASRINGTPQVIMDGLYLPLSPASPGPYHPSRPLSVSPDGDLPLSLPSSTISCLNPPYPPQYFCMYVCTSVCHVSTSVFLCIFYVI